MKQEDGTSGRASWERRARCEGLLGIHVENSTVLQTDTCINNGHRQPS
jgi:hypothetical protein